jgi:hypothetical protein
MIVSSRNLYIDSSADHIGSGDNFDLHLSGDSIRAQDGQRLKLTLLQFNMYSNFYRVNTTNNRVRFRTDVARLAGADVLTLTPKNYATVGDIAAEFAEKLRVELVADARVLTGSATLDASASGVTEALVQPPTGQSIDQGDRILEFLITFDAPHQFTEVIVQCVEADGESFALLGGNRAKDPVSLTSSFTVTIASSTEVVLRGLYPMQRSTSPQVYLRCSLPNSNIEMAPLSGPGPYDTHTFSSNILGVFQTDHEFVHYDSRTDEFFTNLRTKELNHMRLSLTDRKNRPIGRLHGSGSRTAAGDGTAQSTLGNLHFTAVIRIDTIQATHPNMLQAPQQPAPDLKKTGVWQMPYTSRTTC